jgi:hypothetical protein
MTASTRDPTLDRDHAASIPFIRRTTMPRFIVERNIPGASTLSPAELKDIAAKSCDVIAGLGEPYTWITSYVAGDKIYCVHEAASADAIRRHAREGGFPADLVTEVGAVIDPSTATLAAA